jgi:hypothetical protein
VSCCRAGGTVLDAYWAHKSMVVLKHHDHFCNAAGPARPAICTHIHTQQPAASSVSPTWSLLPAPAWPGAAPPPDDESGSSTEGWEACSKSFL